MSFRTKLHHFFNIRGFIDPKILDYPGKNCENPENAQRDTWEDFFMLPSRKLDLRRIRQKSILWRKSLF